MNLNSRFAIHEDKMACRELLVSHVGTECIMLVLDANWTYLLVNLPKISANESQIS